MAGKLTIPCRIENNNELACLAGNKIDEAETIKNAKCAVVSYHGLHSPNSRSVLAIVHVSPFVKKL